MKEILAEARVLAGSGAKEICLIAQDTTAYGREDGGAPKLHKLLQQLERIEDIKWIRLLYTHPAHFYPELIETMAESEKVCRYLDVPLQHVNDRILADMRRRVSKADIETLLEKLRERLPGLTLRTTFIVGFPGETRAKFKELMRFVEKWRFERLGAFVYSPEEDTKAAEFDRQVGGRTKKSRYDELMTLQQAIALDLGEARTGSRELVLVDAPPGEDAFQSARSEAEAPDIDPVIFVKSTGRGIEAGCFTEVKITGIRGYDLEAVPARSRKRLKGESESS